MANKEQVNAVKKALELTSQIELEKSILARLNAERFRAKPKPPTHETVTATYPQIKSDIKFWSPILLLTIVFLPFPLIYYYLVYKPKHEEDIERIRNSEEYKKQCSDIDKEVNRKQKEIDDAFEKATKEYNEVTIPNYEQEKAKWEDDIKQKTADSKARLENAQNELEELYNSTRILPMQYRSIDALEYIYNTIYASEYDIKGAIELYDKHLQRCLDEEILREQQLANALADEQNMLAAQQIEATERQSEEIRKAKNHQDIANVIGAVQRHNTNKAVKNHFGKK